MLAPTAAHDRGASVVLDAGAAPAGPRGWRTRRTVILLAAVLAVTLTAVAARVWHDDDPPLGPGGPAAAAYGMVRLGQDPGPRWQRPITQVAPGLGCGAAIPGSEPRGGACTIVDSVSTAAIVAVVVRHGIESELAGLAPADGTVRWHRAPVAGRTIECLARSGRLWCLTARADPILASSTIDGTTSRPSAPPLPGALAVLQELDPRTGAVRHEVAVPDSTYQAHLAGVGPAGIYIVALPRAGIASVQRYDARGVMAWRRTVPFADALSELPAGDTAVQIVRPQVTEDRGRVYVTQVQRGGAQAVFTATDGSVVESGPGRVVDVVGHLVVSQTGNGALTAGGTTLPANALARLAANDRSAGGLVLAATHTGTNEIVDGQAPVQLRSARAPGDQVARLPGGTDPVAFCAGTVLTHTNARLTGVDPRTGRSRWNRPVADGLSLQVRCAGDAVVFINGAEASAYDVRTGRQRWSVPLPAVSQLTPPAFGDPADGLVFGPDDTVLVAGTPVVTFVR